MIVQGRDTPSHDPDKPRGGGGGRPQKPQRPSHNKPSPKKPAAKPAQKKPSAQKPSRPSKPAQKGKKTAGREEYELIWFDDTEFKPLAQGGHIH